MGYNSGQCIIYVHQLLSFSSFIMPKVNWIIMTFEAIDTKQLYLKECIFFENVLNSVLWGFL